MPVGDQAITLQFKQVISDEVNKQVISMMNSISRAKLHGVTELVPTYASLLVYYDPRLISYQALSWQLHTLVTEQAIEPYGQREVIIPAVYGSKWGPDLEDVALYHKLTPQEVIHIHTSVQYRVYMLGFSPGFPYLGGLPSQLHTPRLSTPRAQVPAGSIGIAGSQTGMYSLATPGGWRIIAHSPLRLFEASNAEAFLLRVGDFVRFTAVSVDEYEDVRDQVLKGTYTPNIVWKVKQK